jgi:anti-anti-sigma regulatory factor
VARPESGGSASTEAPVEAPRRARSERVRRVAVVEEFGSVLVGRAAGTEMRRTIEAIAASSNVVVDLDGVRMMSGSFADQLFGAIDRALLADGTVRFDGVPPSIARLAWFVRDRREQLGR